MKYIIFLRRSIDRRRLFDQSLSYSSADTYAYMLVTGKNLAPGLKASSRGYCLLAPK